MPPLAFTRQSALMLVAMSLVMLIVSIGLISYVPKKNQLKNEHDMVLVNGTTAFKIWKDIPLPIYERLYFFNITNAEDFLNHTAKLKVAEVGPYTYKGKWVKNILGWHPNGTVSYREETTYHFIPEESNGTENDVIVTLNGPLISVVNLAQTLPQKRRDHLSWWLSFNGEKLIIQKTVSELAYKGYKDAIMDEVSFFFLSEHFKDGRFSWLYGRNYSSDGFLTVFTGEQDFSKLNLIDNWNGKKRVCGSDSLCNIITGTNGELSPPLKPGQMSYTVFQPAFCKSLTFELSGEETVKGILSHKFMATDATLNDLSNLCSSSTKSLPAGLRDLGSCYFGAPIIQSFPHFYLADSSLVQAIDGLNPDSKKHISYIKVEPTSGLSVELAMRYQINLPLKRFKGFQEFQNVSKGIIPVFWGEITASSTEELSELIENQIIDRTGNRVRKIILGIGIFVSVVTLIGSSVMLASTYSFKYGMFISRNDTLPLLQVTSETPCINEYETSTTNKFFMTVKEGVMNIRSKLI